MENQAYDKRHEAESTSNVPPSYEMVSKVKEETSFSVEMPHFNRQDSIMDNQGEAITFCWKDLSIKIKGTEARNGFCGIGKRQKTDEKYILRNVSGYCKPGQLLAIMGASGAGKSTLLNALTFRNLGGLTVEGVRLANGIPVNPNTLTSVSAYVQQDDLFIGTLTVREHLNFQAAVRMDKNIPHNKRMERVEKVLQELGLKKCEKTLIGVQGRIKGISGGEMKRLAFASEVLTNPPLMFCDEPTSGLDSYMAQNVVEVLKKLAQMGKTIVCTIHQPSSQVFAMFDRVLLMAEGRVAFLGGTNEAMDFFQSIDLPCPYNFNPADHYIHVLAVTPGNEDQCRQTITRVCDDFETREVGRHILSEIEYQTENVTKETSGRLSKVDEKRTSSSPYKASWWDQFKALLWRSFLAVIKEPMIMQVRIFQTIVIALILGIIYFGQENDQAGIMNINGALFLLITNMTFANMFAVVNVFTMELPIFLREHFNGMYRTDVYFLCKQIAEFPLFIITPLLFNAIYYWMVGMNEDVDRFFISCAILLMVTQVVVSFGYMISCLAPNLQVALALAPTLIIPVMLFGGFFLNNASVPDWLIWLKYISWFMYTNELLVVNQWADTNVTGCTPDVIESGTPCFPNGNAVLEFYGFSEDNVAFNFLMLAVLAIAFRLIGFVALLGKTFRKSN